MDDSQIIALYFARSERALAETDAKYGRYCRTVAANILPDGRDAEEAVADAYMAEVLSGGTDPAQAAEDKALTESLDRFLGTLPDTERRVFLRRYWYLDGIGAICARFGFSRSKVKSMLSRTRKKLLDHLKKEDLYER